MLAPLLSPYERSTWHTLTVVPQTVVVGPAGRSFAAIDHLLQTVVLQINTPQYVQCTRAFDVWSTQINF